MNLNIGDLVFYYSVNTVSIVLFKDLYNENNKMLCETLYTFKNIASGRIWYLYEDWLRQDNNKKKMKVFKKHKTV